MFLHFSTECSDKGGVADGNCASGFGVCCTFLVSDCGSTVSNNCTYIQNPSYPASYTTAGACEYSVTPQSNEICQLRWESLNHVKNSSRPKKIKSYISLGWISIHLTWRILHPPAPASTPSVSPWAPPGSIKAFVVPIPANMSTLKLVEQPLLKS